MVSDRAEISSQGVLFPKSIPLTTVSRLLESVEDKNGEVAVRPCASALLQTMAFCQSALFLCVLCGQHSFGCGAIQTGNTGPPGQLLWSELIHPIKWFDSVKQPVSLTIYLTWLIGCLDEWMGSRLFGGSIDTAFVGSDATGVMLSDTHQVLPVKISITRLDPIRSIFASFLIKSKQVNMLLILCEGS